MKPDRPVPPFEPADSPRFEFATATRIRFGPGALEDCAPDLAGFGSRALVVTGAQAERARPLLALLEHRGVSAETWSCAGEPTIEGVREGVALARAGRVECVIGFGGGSALDAAKAVAALVTNDGDVLDYLEVIGRGRPLEKDGLPFVAIPTTAGTGSEVTRNAVLASPEHRVKASLRSPRMLARLAIVDPLLTLGLPPAVTAATGLDALTQLIEPFVSSRANPLTDGFCREGIPRVARSLRRAWAHPDDRAARTDMALASLLSGLALANAGLGAVHGFAAPLGGLFDAPHGAVCAALLPHVMEANLRAARERGAPVVGRYAEVARLLTGDPQAMADDGVTWVRAVCAVLAIPSLGTWGVTPGDLSRVSEMAANASSMKGNPVPLSPEEREAILQAALGA